MANQCTNILEIHCKDESVLNQLIKQIQADFECYYTNDDEEDNSCDFEFASRGGFPKDEFEELTKRFEDESLYIQVITYELANEVLEHHVYKKGKWTDMIAVKSANNQNQKYHE